MIAAAGFLAHIGRRFQIATRDRIGVRRYADLSAHIVLAPSAVLLGCALRGGQRGASGAGA